MTQPIPESPSVDRRKTIVGVVVAIVVVVVVFGVIFPQLVDWNEVFDTLRSVDTADLVLLLVLGVLMYVPAGWLYAIVLPGIGLGRGTQAWVASTAVSTTIPGFDLVLRIAMYTSWGQPIETATTAMFLSGVVEMSTKLVLAIVATAIAAAVVADLGLLAVAGIAAAVVGAVAVVIVAVLRSEERARRVGDSLQRLVFRVFSKLNRKAPTEVEERILGARVHARHVLGSRWPQAFGAAAATQAIVFAILVLSLRSVGVGSEVLSLADILLVQALVIIITSVPITPGSIGVAGLAYVGLFSALAGDAFASEIAAGVLLYRAVTWLLPIPLGWGAALWWKSRSGRRLFSTPPVSERASGPAAADTMLANHPERLGVPR
ncbi:MAG: lysylphosphatidylglycerol synthase transmembrane domain-containing protein [Microthrixaceae bacterium]